MKRVLIFGYRDWARRVYDIMVAPRGYDITFASNPGYAYNPEWYDIIILVGWSWKIPDEVLDKSYVVAIHPSDLPEYAGGTPIQHQILDGIKETNCTLFRVTSEIDAGPILYKTPISLEGEMDDILEGVSDASVDLIVKFLKEFPNQKETPQAKSLTPPRRRRTPADCEIKLTDFENKTATELYNKIRCLQDPYPNAYVVCKDGTKLYLTGSKIE